MDHSLSARWPVVRDYLFSLRNRGSRFGIERMDRLAALLDRPHASYPVLHVAGTNGKGSVCVMLDAMLQAGGLKTGLFTSPHLVHVGERVQINRVRMDEASLVAYVDDLQPLAKRMAEEDPDLHPTFFEFLTAIAFEHFKRSRVDVAVVEVGLGGRLDATNVVEPTVTVITSIGLDHQHILGNTLEAIAHEKGGILMPETPTVLGVLPPEAEGILRDMADARDCPVHSVRERFGLVPSGPLTRACYERLPETRLPGRYQRLNAATAWLASELAGQINSRLALNDDARRTGLASVQWQGRWQEMTMANGARLILDATHNADGLREVEPTLAELRQSVGAGLKIMTGIVGTDRAPGLLAVLTRFAGTLYLARPQQPRACDFAELRAALPRDFTCRLENVNDLREAFPAPGICQLIVPGETLLVIGSIYLIGEILEQLEGHPADNALQDQF